MFDVVRCLGMLLAVQAILKTVAGALADKSPDGLIHQFPPWAIK